MSRLGNYFTWCELAPGASVTVALINTVVTPDTKDSGGIGLKAGNGFATALIALGVVGSIVKGAIEQGLIVILRISTKSIRGSKGSLCLYLHRIGR